MGDRMYDSWTKVSLEQCDNCLYMNPAEREECAVCEEEL